MEPSLKFNRSIKSKQTANWSHHMFCKFLILRRLVIILALLIIVHGLASCKKKEEAPASSPTSAGSTASAPVADNAAPEGEAVPQQSKRKIILNHAFSLEVKDFKVAVETLTKLAESSGGYVFNSTRSTHDKTINYGEVGMRVPVREAGNVLARIRGLGRVDSENSSAEDITDGYVDLEARLTNARSAETRLVELYRKAGKIADVLAVEKELTRVRGDIEAFEAKKKNLDILTDMVTIDVSMTEASSGLPSFNRIWSPIQSAFGKALTGFADSLHVLIIFLGAIIPWLVVFVPLGYWYLRKRRIKSREQSLLQAKDISTL
jgi:hypothetical protein